MKSPKLRNLARAVAFFVIAAIITCTVAFARDGWQPTTNEPENGNTNGGTNGPQNGDTVENTDGDNKTPTDKGDNSNDIITGESTPKYYDYITGLEITQEEAKIAPFSFIYDSNLPLYGASDSLMMIEIPTEYGNTRFVSFTRAPYELGKIGTLTSSRGYIYALMSSFGGIGIYHGNDDKFDYGAEENSGSIDLDGATGYYYTEYTNRVYTNGDLIKAYIANNNLVFEKENVIMPFDFKEQGKQSNIAGQSCKSIRIAYSSTNSSLLTYSSTEGKYTLSKNGELLKDQLNGAELKYDNVFVLFANAATYETADATQTIIDTTGGGVGYYVSCGQSVSIQWRTDSSGSLLFFDSNGNRLTVNRGTSFISIMKASNTAEVIMA